MRSWKLLIWGLMLLFLLCEAMSEGFAALSVDQWQHYGDYPCDRGLSMMDLSFCRLKQEVRDTYFDALSPKGHEWNFYCLSNAAKIRHFLILGEESDEADENHLNARDKNFRYLPRQGKVAFWDMLSQIGRKLNFKLLPDEVMVEKFPNLSNELDSEGYSAKDFNFRFLPQPWRDGYFADLSPKGQLRNFCWLSEDARVQQFPRLSDEPNAIGWTCRDSNFIHLPQNTWDQFFDLLSLQGQNAYFRKLSQKKRISQWNQLSNIPDRDGLTSRERHFKHLPLLERGKVFHLLRPVAQGIYFDLLLEKDKVRCWPNLDVRGKDKNFCNLPLRAQTMKRLRQLSLPAQQLHYRRVFYTGL